MGVHLVFHGWHAPNFLGLLALGFLSPSILAQGTGNILGRISSETEGTMLTNALVSISGTGLHVLSGEEGWYFLTGIPEGRREVTVALPGFAEARDTIELGPDDTIILDFHLRPDPVPIDELVITADVQPLGTLVHRKVIGKEELARRQASTVTQLLQGLVPGMIRTVTSGDVGSAAQIRLRGVRSLRGSPPLFFVDGIRIGSSRIGGPTGTGGVLTFLDNISPRDIDRIEILHAAEATTLFGTGAAGGAILIYTKR